MTALGEVPALDEAFAHEFLVGYQLASAEGVLGFERVDGGVSSIVMRVKTRRGDLILKQPRERFQVDQEWRVDRRRCFVEHAFARVLGRMLARGSLSELHAFAPQFFLLVFRAAPTTWRPWKQDLLSDRVEPIAADAAAHLLAAIHRAGEEFPALGRFENDALFIQQRIEPYFETTARRVPERASELRALHARFRRRRDLVHGDFSPKNLLTDGEAVMLVDHEVATRGDAAFDVAFLLNHLVLKSLHLPRRRTELLDLGTRFLRVYGHERRDDSEVEARAMTYLGPLVLARVWGKSPVEYLASKEKEAATRLGLAWTQAPPASWSEAARQSLP